MLHPKLILFTNRWVWNSPVFGALVRMADYYPIMQGLENNLDLLADRVKRGYSIVVFPEGTRGHEGQMRRFHRGAFYLAEKLGADILPIVIHGSGNTLTKGDFLLKNGTVTLKMLPRISPLDTRFGTGYGERAKRVRRYFGEEYALLRKKIEQPKYFREQLLYNYLYKGPVLEWYLRVKLRLEKYYQVFHDQLPREGKILDLGCGYGFMSYLLHFSSTERQITGIDYDREKIDTANHCFSKDDNLQFECADAKSFEFLQYEGIILSDVLHYLETDQQEKLLEKCMASLQPGGVILIRDGDKDLAARHRKTKWTEFFSTSLFHFNKTEVSGLNFLSAQFVQKMAHSGAMECVEMDLSKHTSNKLYVIKHAPRIAQCAI